MRHISLTIITFLAAIWAMGLYGRVAAASEGAPPEAAAFKVVVVTPPYNHNAGRNYSNLFSQEVEKYWGGKVEHHLFPTDFLARQKEVTAAIANLAKNPLVRAVVVGEGLPGTLEGITRLRVERPDIFVIVIDPHEDLETTTRVATLTVNLNSAARGYIYPTMAGRMGARTLVYFSIPRHQAEETIARQKRILSAVAGDMGMILVTDLGAPDPAGGDRQAIGDYLARAIDAYQDRYGPDLAFITTSTVYTDILIPLVMEKGGAVLETIHSSPLLGFPEALGLTEEAESLFGRWHELLTVMDEKYMESAPKAQFALWPYPYPHTVILSMTDIVVSALENRADIYDLKGVTGALEKFSPGSKWLVSTIMNYQTGAVLPQAVLVLEDTYWLGHGFQGFTRLNIPTKYYRIK